MHFLMPSIFSSREDFNDWFSNPITGMMEGNVEYSAPLIQRLHKVNVFSTSLHLHVDSTSIHFASFEK